MSVTDIKYRENDDAHNMFRSYNNCYFSSSEPVTDEDDEFYLRSSSITVEKVLQIPY